MNNKVDFNIQYLQPVLLDLLNHDKRDMVFQMLELYYKKAKTVSDFDILGFLSLKQEHRELYLKCAEAAYSLAENSQQLYIARSNLYKAYNVMNRPEDALFYIDMNLKITPDDFETLTQKAYNIALTGDKETSEKMLLELLKKYPEKEESLKSSLSGKILREGRIAEGVLSFLGTFKNKSTTFDEILKMKRWLGVVQPGKIVYIEGEGGIGDEIINIRFFKYLIELGMKPILYSAWSKYREDTVSLFRRNGFEVITDTYSIDRTQLWAPMMSLPGFLNLNESDLWYGTYLTPIRDEKNKINGKKLKIGIKCSGNPYFSQDEYRKIPIEKMLQYLPNDAEIYYIDKEKVNHPRVIDLADRISTWEDTLDFIDQMDCIVSSCTSLVHAAGAIGKTTHVIVPIAEYYIWTTSSKSSVSPWYGNNFQVHKQTKLRQWDEPLSNVKKQLDMMGKNE